MNKQDQGNISILIAEDSRVQARILEKKLVEAGYQVRTAENGEVAMQLIRKERPTLVISDIEMPKMTGYELCSAIKSDPELKAIPVILLSTLSDARDIIEGLHSGADNYVTKPYDPAYLISRVESLLETPLDDDDEDQALNVTLGGKHYSVKSGRQRVLNLLISTFENAVEKNNELIHLNEELTVAKEQLSSWNVELESLNEELENANNRMSTDLEAAAKVQQSLLPTSLPDSPRVKFAWKYLPCDELGGDFLNVISLDEKNIAAFVVDVCGHGVASSLLSVTIGKVLTSQVSSSSILVQNSDGTDKIQVTPPSKVTSELNRRFPMEEQNGLFFTMSYGVLDLESLKYHFCSAGHEPIVHVPKSGQPKFIDSVGNRIGLEDLRSRKANKRVFEGQVAIGWVDDMTFEEQVLDLQPGDRVYLYSDGIPEAMDGEHNQFGMPQLLEIIELGKSQTLNDNVSLLLKTIERWCSKNGPTDDVSILAFEITDECVAAQPRVQAS